jgi:hypothetical protein
MFLFSYCIVLHCPFYAIISKIHASVTDGLRPESSLYTNTFTSLLSIMHFQREHSLRLHAYIAWSSYMGLLRFSLHYYYLFFSTSVFPKTLRDQMSALTLQFAITEFKILHHDASSFYTAFPRKVIPLNMAFWPKRRVQ